MYLYIITAPVYRNIIKIGFTEDPYGRWKTYQTGCPPGLTPSHDLEYRYIWKICVTKREDAFHIEDLVHNRFIKYRMMRQRLGDSEWFNFENEDGASKVKEYVEKQPWFEKEVTLHNIPRNTVMQNHYYKNTCFLYGDRLERLNEIQKPMIARMREFIQNTSCMAGYVVAPCGAGKTVMMCKSLIGLDKIVICCPTQQIQKQWCRTLLREHVCQDIVMIGSDGMTNMETIQELMKRDKYCLISTYMSSVLLMESIHTCQLLVLDEAHHVAGIIAQEEGIGRTRQLMKKACDENVKRLSMTFTPRMISTIYENVLTMDNVDMFGPLIYEMKWRRMISLGLLPDYRLWCFRDVSCMGKGLITKCEYIVKAWNAMEMYRGKEQYILHHLIIFASTNEESRQICMYLSRHLQETLLLCVKGGDNIETNLEHFTNAKRSILVNCKVLGEGVDIPIAQAVMITYPKKSCEEITQMLLRAGRWHPEKPIFHILFPICEEEDYSAFQQVLTSLTFHDEYLQNEVCVRSLSNGEFPKEWEHHEEEMMPECIVMDIYESHEIKNCFQNMSKVSRESIQQLCIREHIDTSLDYKNKLCKKYPKLCQDPRHGSESWYEYLHPHVNSKITAIEFLNDILKPHMLNSAYKYEMWRRENKPTGIPSVQHILDGYFDGYSNFNGLLLYEVSKRRCKK